MRLKRSVKVGTESHQCVDALVLNNTRGGYIIVLLSWFRRNSNKYSIISPTGTGMFHFYRTENGSDNSASEEHLEKSKPSTVQVAI